MSAPLKGPFALLLTLAGVGVFLIWTNPQWTLIGQLLIVSAISWIGSTIVSNHGLATFQSKQPREFPPSPPATGFLEVSQVNPNPTLDPQELPVVSWISNNGGPKELSTSFFDESVTNEGNTISYSYSGASIASAVQTVRYVTPTFYSIVEAVVKSSLQVPGPQFVGVGISCIYGNDGFGTILFQSNQPQQYRFDSMTNLDEMGTPLILQSEQAVDVPTFLNINSLFLGSQSDAIVMTNQVANQTSIINNIAQLWNYEKTPQVPSVQFTPFLGNNSWNQVTIMQYANPASVNNKPIVVSFWQAATIPLQVKLSSEPFLTLEASKNVKVRITCMNGLSSQMVGPVLDSAKARIGISGDSMYPSIQWSKPGTNYIEISMTTAQIINLQVSGIGTTQNQQDIQYLLAITIQDL